MPYFTSFLSVLGLILLGAEARIPSRNLTTGVFLSYNEYNSNAVYEAWKGPGEFSLLFNSCKPTAFLAYQDDSTYNHFDLFLVRGKIRARITFDECQWKQLTVEGNFSDSQWHRLRLTRQLNNVSLTVDGCYSQSIPCRYASTTSERWQALYVGSIPWNISDSSQLAKPGIFRDSITFPFQGCIGHVTQTAPGENSRPLALRSSAWAGSDCKSSCAPGWKCSPIDDVTHKECECPGYGNKKPACKLQSSKSNDDLSTIIMASSSALSQSVQMTSNKSTAKLSSAVQTNVKATSSSKITDSATPTSTQSASKHVQGSSGVKAQYVGVAYLDQQSSIPGKSSHPQPLGLVSASTSLFTLDGVFPSSVQVQPNSSVDNNGSAMTKKGNNSRILCSFVLVCLAPAVSLLSGFMTQ